MKYHLYVCRDTLIETLLALFINPHPPLMVYCVWDLPNLPEKYSSGIQPESPPTPTPTPPAPLPTLQALPHKHCAGSSMTYILVLWGCCYLIPHPPSFLF